MKKARKNELFELVTVDDARAVKERLDRNRLNQLWLIHRLDRDFGIRVKKSQLSETLDGKRPIGPRTQRLIWCCGCIIDEYEKFYGGRL